VSLDLLATALTAAAGIGGGLLAPMLIAGLREPEVEAPGPPRPTYLEVAATRRLAPILATVGALVGALVGWRLGWIPVLAAWAFLTAVCVVLGYVDARTRLLPTQLIAPSYWVVAGLLMAAALADRSADGLWHAGLGWAFMGGFYYLMWRLGPRGLGYGDVRLSGLLALCLGYLGWGALVTGLYAGFVLGGLGSLTLLLARRANLKTQLPFGPYMMVGALVGLVWGHQLSDWYLTR
jgi:leader peptidase (prepilin peptidase)/N-methyltransferase